VAPLAMMLSACGGQAVDDVSAESSSSAGLSAPAVTESTDRYGASYFPLTPAMSQDLECYAYCYSSGKTLVWSYYFDYASTTLASATSIVRTAESNELKVHPAAVCELNCESLAYLEGDSNQDGLTWLNFCPGSWSVAECTQYGAY
jgi:hypothetical protein